MSAWSTNGRHNAIVADALETYGLVEANEVDNVYHELAYANELSLNYRDGDDLDEAEANRLPYVPGGEVNEIGIFGLVMSYQHQSCEHPRYDKSQVGKLIEYLLEKMSHQHGLTRDLARDHRCFAWSTSDLSERDNAAWLTAAQRQTSE